MRSSLGQGELPDQDLQNSVNHFKAKVGSLSRSRSEDDQELLEARRSLKAANVAAYIERVISEAPPLTDEQVDRIALLLRPARNQSQPDRSGNASPSWKR